MWKQPHILYCVQSGDAPLELLEDLVPGTLVYARVGRRMRLHKMSPSERECIESFDIYVPIHGAWLVEGALAHAGYRYMAVPANVRGIDYWREDQRSALESQGRELIARLIEDGLVRPHVADLVTPYQAINVAWCENRPWSFNIWACGSGKTLAGILASLSARRTGPTLVLCPAKARHVWWSQIQEYTTLVPFRVRPQGERKPDDEILEDYLQRFHDEAFVIIGVEAVLQYMQDILLTQPGTVIFDEMHLHGSAKRWKAIHQDDGSVDFKKRTTKANNHTRAVAMMDISRMDCVKRRVALTATPLDDGRPRRLWSQLDLLSPGGFAHSYRRFANRYCDAREGEYGGIDDKGSSNLDELRARCSFFTHEVPYSESHSALPDTRLQVVYLDHSELNRAGRYDEDQTFTQAFKTLAKQAKYDAIAKERFIEARLAEACTRKRKYVVDEVAQGVRGGGKVVVFTARRAETEVWAQKIRKHLSQGDEHTIAQVWMAHGGVSETERNRITDTYATHPGPCVLVATGQSIGTGVDGMQSTDLAIFAMLPWKPGDFTQWKGRFDRLGGRPTLLKVAVAVGTYDEKVVEILTNKFGPIEEFLAADELKGVSTKLLGLEDKDALVDSIVAKLGG